MKRLYLCGHTGSANRGCEAIVRSTVKVLREGGAEDITLLTFKESDDRIREIDKIVDLMSYPKKTIFNRGCSWLSKKLFNNGIWGARFYHKSFIKQIDNANSLLFNIGGDTYCYGTPNISYAMNDLAEEHKVPNVFWGCSVEEDSYKDSRMVEDFNKYSAIVVREELSYQAFLKCVKDKSKIFKTCDPAFHLEIKETELPENFVIGNTVGINISPLVLKNIEDDGDMMYQNVYELIDYIISDTDMNVCLIPHVYNVENNLHDSKVLTKIYSKYAETDRVSIVNTELSCCELKYIISQCRFFIGARTHSTIAAYSTAVPCIALSYSVKSRGIAIDLFGTDDGYAISYKKINDKKNLKEKFISVLLNNEECIRNKYREILPKYKQSIIDATMTILSSIGAE